MHDDTGEMIGTLLMFSPLGAFETAPILVQLLMLLIAVAGVIAVIAAIVRRTSGSPKSSLLKWAGQVGLYAGGAGAGYLGMETWLTAKQMHVTRFVIYEPEVISAVFVLLLGVIVWLIARFGNAGGKRA